MGPCPGGGFDVYFLFKKINNSKPLSHGRTQLSCLEYESYHVSLFVAQSVAPSLTGLAQHPLRYIHANPPGLGGNSRFVIRIVGCFSTFSLPLTHCLSMG